MPMTLFQWIRKQMNAIIRLAIVVYLRQREYSNSKNMAKWQLLVNGFIQWIDKTYSNEMRYQGILFQAEWYS